MKNTQKAMLGFESFSDFTNTIFGLKYTIFNMITAFIAGFTTFITTYIWDSSSAVYTLLSLMLFDWTLGVFLAIKATISLRGKLSQKDKVRAQRRAFSSKKFPRIFISIPIAFWILSVSWNLSKASPMFYVLPGLVYGGFAGTYVMSLWENLTEMGFFSKELLQLVKDKMDVTKLFKK